MLTGTASVVVALVFLASDVTCLDDGTEEFGHFDETYTARNAAHAAEVKQMFMHGYDSYMRHAFPMDELCPLTCTGRDTWGSYALTLIDSLSTLYIFGNLTEFDYAVHQVKEKVHLAIDRNVSVFETNIRILGGLISAHIFALERLTHHTPAGEEPFQYNGELLEMAIDTGERLLPAFKTPTGIPYGTVNLRHGIPPGESTVTSLAGAGTYLIEFGMLTRLTNDHRYENAARGAMRALWARRSAIGLVGNHIEIRTGKWVYYDSGIGPNQDSFYEYLLKAHILFGDPEYLTMFNDFYYAINKHMKKDSWYVDVNMDKGSVTLPWFTALGGFWPGVQVLYGDLGAAANTMSRFHEIWRRYGFAPEALNLHTNKIVKNLDKYFLRPEMIESTMYLAHATADPLWTQFGLEFMNSIQYSTWTPCGYAIVKNVSTHELDDRMESFFLSETLKYLYLIFDADNMIHKGNYVFSTEAHPFEVTKLTRDSKFWAKNAKASCVDNEGTMRTRCPRKQYATRVSSYAADSQQIEPVLKPTRTGKMHQRNEHSLEITEKSTPSAEVSEESLEASVVSSATDAVGTMPNINIANTGASMKIDIPVGGLDTNLLAQTLADKLGVDVKAILKQLTENIQQGSTVGTPKSGQVALSPSTIVHTQNTEVTEEEKRQRIKQLSSQMFDIKGSVAKTFWSYEVSFGQAVWQYDEKQKEESKISLGFRQYGKKLETIAFEDVQGVVDGLDDGVSSSVPLPSADSELEIHVQHFTHGAYCTAENMQGQRRSTIVSYICKRSMKENTFGYSVAEPQLCQYDIKIHTPSACIFSQ
eukprot:m.11812 g.11812  ORF g.11812 m.11812 type:complete len:814 (-) comp8994_c0_seq1:39-2480(-)